MNQSFELKKNNIFLIVLFLNNFFPVFRLNLGIAWSLINFTLFLGFLLYTITGKIKIQVDKYVVFSTFIFLFWLVYSLITYLWAAEKKPVLVYSYTILINFSVFFLTYQLIRTKHDYKIIVIGLIILNVIYCVIALWEIMTMNHLPNSRFVDMGIIHFIPTGPFYNENNFAAILLLISPFIMFSFLYFKKMLIKMLVILLSASSLIIFLVQGARLALIFSGLFFFIFSILFFNKYFKILLISIFALMLVIFPKVKPQEYKLAKIYFTNVIESIYSENVSIKPSSVKIRKELINASVDMFFESKMFGIGSANFEDKMQRGKNSDTYGIINSHNFIMELLATNGLIVFLLVIYSIFYLVIKNFKLALQNETNFRYWFFASSIAGLLFFVTSSIPSSIEGNYVYWIVLGLITVTLKFESKTGNECL